MRKRSERYFVYLSLLIVFCCLLLSGGSRLIGREGGEMALPQPPEVLSGMFYSAPAQRPETGCASVRDHADKVVVSVVPVIQNKPDTAVCSDANGNVLRQETYLRAVYQAFSLGDGFA